jgi:hypothetical protein
MDLDWTFQLKNGVPALTPQSLIPGGSVEIAHENLFGDSQSLTVSLSSSDWRFPAQDLGFQMSYSEPFYKAHTTRNVQVSRAGCQQPEGRLARPGRQDWCVRSMLEHSCAWRHRCHTALAARMQRFL